MSSNSFNRHQIDTPLDQDGAGVARLPAFLWEASCRWLYIYIYVYDSTWFSVEAVVGAEQQCRESISFKLRPGLPTPVCLKSFMSLNPEFLTYKTGRAQPFHRTEWTQKESVAGTQFQVPQCLKPLGHKHVTERGSLQLLVWPEDTSIEVLGTGLQFWMFSFP